MRRLFKAGFIKSEEYGRRDKAATRIVRVSPATAPTEAD